MKVYLVQHALALPKDENPSRPLSARGGDDARKVGDFAAAAGVDVARVLHSGKMRAEQTARILADALGAEGRVVQADGLSPNDPVESFAGILDEVDGDVLIVGHLPFMARLASFLMAGDAEQQSVAFKPGSLVCLDRGDDRSWALEWMIRPELLENAGR